MHSTMRSTQKFCGSMNAGAAGLPSELMANSSADASLFPQLSRQPVCLAAAWSLQTVSVILAASLGTYRLSCLRQSIRN